MPVEMIKIKNKCPVCKAEQVYDCKTFHYCANCLTQLQMSAEGLKVVRLQ